MKRTITSSLVTKKKHVKINQTNLDKAMGDQLRRALDLHWIVERQIPGLMAMYRQKSNPVQNSMIVSVRQAVNAQNMVHFQRLFR
jgi:lauroyl/myristoyl acyltransferase